MDLGGVRVSPGVSSSKEPAVTSALLWCGALRCGAVRYGTSESESGPESGVITVVALSVVLQREGRRRARRLKRLSRDRIQVDRTEEYLTGT